MGRWTRLSASQATGASLLFFEEQQAVCLCVGGGEREDRIVSASVRKCV